MKLNDSFWKHFELDLQEDKAIIPKLGNWIRKENRKDEYRHLFLWDHQERYVVINSRYGRAFSYSPFGSGVRGVPRSKYKGIPRGLDEIDIALKTRLAENTRHIRNAIA
jgi:hypothetical protein